MTKISAITYLVRDYDEAIAWFVSTLGFVLIEDIDMGEGKRWVVVAPDARGGVNLLLAKAVGPTQIEAIGKVAGGRVGFFLNTENFVQDHARMMAAGVEFKEPPRHEPYGIVAVFADLYGNLWDLIEPKQGV
jgi:catechol 2,3-dioxygenase-like lactoylglutathione lyase family enzyme